MTFSGHKRPLFIVGNKVDLIPQDSAGYLRRIKRSIFDTLVSAGVSPNNIKDIAVISAKTGYGIEDLITQIHNVWGSKGNCQLYPFSTHILRKVDSEMHLQMPCR